MLLSLSLEGRDGEGFKTDGAMGYNSQNAYEKNFNFSRL